VSRFAFEAIDRRGLTIRGVLEAPDKADVIGHLLQTGHTPITVRLARPQPVQLFGFKRIFGSSGFDYVALLRELGTLLKAGLPAERALTTLKSLSSDEHAALRVQQIVDRIRGGEALSQAFAAAVPEAPAHIARLLAAGEASGRLAEVIGRLATGLSKLRSLRARVISDLSYPAILVVAIGVVLWVIFHTVLPRLAPMFLQLGTQMPLPTQILVNLGSFFDSYGWELAVAIAAGLAGLVYAVRQPRTRLLFDRFAMTSRLGLGISRAFAAAMFCRTFQTLLEGGLPLERSLGTVAESITNRALRAEIAKVQVSVREGVRLSQALVKLAPCLPSMISEFAAVGEETGRLASMMGEAADILEDGAQTRLNRVTTLIVPITTLVMGALVALLMSGIVSGILAINDLPR
jgi:general secretion pathway protein F